MGLALRLPMGTLRWPHLQRLAERWLRRWGFALSGLALGLWGVWLSHAEVNEGHAKAVQAVAGLRQQLATLPGVLSAKPGKPLSFVEQKMLASLPGAIRQEHIWGDVQQALTQHGLQLLSLRPLPPTGADPRHGGLSSHTMAIQLRGRFEDWTRMWAACALTGPLCAMDRISVVATAKPAEVQIDVVLRIWMRPVELGVPEFMCQHGFHLTGVELLEQGVEKHHPFLFAKASEKCIRVGRAAAAVHHKKTVRLETGALHQLVDTFFQFSVFQRLELVEQGHDEIGRDPHHKQLVCHQQCPRPKPPQAAA